MLESRQLHPGAGHIDRGYAASRGHAAVLDHVPLGGACGIVALRRALRACNRRCRGGGLHRRRHQPRRLVSTESRQLQRIRARRRAALRIRGRTPASRSDLVLHAHLCATRKTSAKSASHNATTPALSARLFKKKLSLEEYLNARLIADPIRLFDCVMPAVPKASWSWRRERKRSAAVRTCALDLREAQCVPDDPIQMRGGWCWSASICTGRRRRARRHRLRATTTIIRSCRSFSSRTSASVRRRSAEFIRRNSFTVDGVFRSTHAEAAFGRTAGCAAGFLVSSRPSAN